MRWLLLSMIFLSGVSGLAYEVVWHRYLAILLGAQAKATAIILAIFLGGIACGYHMFGRWSRWKKWNLLRAYATVELGLAFWAFIFPFLFRVMMPLTAKLYGVLGINTIAIDLFVSILLIGLPTFLMGGTLPLLTQGLSDDFKKASSTHATIYGVNTLGACFGCLFSGYVLIPTVGLPGTVVFGGFLNLAVALFSFFLFARGGKINEPMSEAPPLFKFDFQFTRPQQIILAVGFLSGFTLLSLQTILIRLVGLSAGSSNYNFALIVSIFICALGVGSLVARRIEHYTVRNLFWNQLALAASLFLLYCTLNYWPYGVHVLRTMFRDIVEAFYPFQFTVGLGFALLLMLPIGFAGLTLPLCFHLLKDREESLGHRVGQLYGLNALGCVLGALIGGYLLLNWFNLDQLFKMVILLTLLSTTLAGLLYWNSEVPNFVRTTTGVMLGALAVLTFFAPLLNRSSFTQPFRHPEPIAGVTYKGPAAFAQHLARTTEYVLFKDGPNTSVGVGASRYQGKELSRTIFVNGKSDGNTRGDFLTTVMLAHLPGLLAPKVDQICVIGFGTGITIGTIAKYDEVQRVDVADISGTILENAHLFDSYNGGVSKNVKVHFNEMDAFRFLQGTKRKFNVIISEPSNPWVAGIENLYTSEFYEIAKRQLTPDGMLVQWLHTYSFDNDLFRMILRTMSGHFPYISVFQLKGGDFALVATNKMIDRADLRRAKRRYEGSPQIREAMAEAGMNRFETLLAFELIPHTLVKPLASGAFEHTLEYPLLSNEAAKAFFTGSAANPQALRRQYKEFYASVSDSLLADYLGNKLPSMEVLTSFRDTMCEHIASKNNTLCDEAQAAMKAANPSYVSQKSYDSAPSMRDLASLATFSAKRTPKFTSANLQEVYDMFEVYKKYYSPLSLIPSRPFYEKLEQCIGTVSKKEQLWGECLLQKLVVLETTQLRGPEFKESVAMYLEWFETIPKEGDSYHKLKEAREILMKIVAQSK